MNDNTVVLDIEYQGDGAKRANADLDAIEKKATSASERSSQAVQSHISRVLAITDRNQNSIERIVSAAERKAAATGQSAAQRIADERDLLIKRVSGDEAAINRVTAAYAKLAAAQAQSDKTGRQSVVDEITRRTASPVERLLADRAGALQKVAGDPAAVAAVTQQFGKLITAEHEAAEAAHGLEIAEKIKQGFENPIIAAGGAVQGLVSKVGIAGVVGAASLIGIGLAAKEAFEFVAEAGEKAKGIANLSDILGTTVGEAQRLDAMAKIASVDIGGLTGFMRKLSQSLVDGGAEGKKGADALRDIGVSARDSEGNLKGTYQLLREIAGGLDDLSTPEKIARLTQIGGRGAVSLLPLIKNFRETETAAKAAGAGLNEDVINQLEAADDKIKTLSVSFDLLKTNLGGKISTVVIPVVVALQGLLTGSTKLIAAGEKGLSKAFTTAIIGNTLAAGLFPLDTLELKAPAPKATGDALLTDSQRRGEQLRQQFLARNEIDNIRDKIQKKDEDLRKAEAELDSAPAHTNQGFIERTVAKITALHAEDDALKLNLKTLTELPERQKQARDAAAEAAASELTGISKINAERAKQITQLSTITENGKTKQINLAKEAPSILADINAASEARIRSEQRKTSDEFEALQQKTSAITLDNYKTNLHAQEELADSSLSTLESKELLSRREVEDERLRIHKQTIDSVAALDKKQITDQAELEIKQLRQQQSLAVDPRDRSAIQAKIDEAGKQLAAKTGQVDQAAANAKAQSDKDQQQRQEESDRQYREQTKAYQFETQQQVTDAEIRGLSQQKDLRIAALGLEQRDTLSGKLATEQARLGIEVDFLKRAEVLELELIDRRKQREKDSIDEAAKHSIVSAEEINLQKQAVDDRYLKEKISLSKDTDAAIAAASIKTTVEQTDTIKQHLTSVYDTFKHESEGVFDAMLSKSQNVFVAMGNALKNALLTAVKDVVSSHVAATLTELVTGQKVSLVSDQGGTGILGKITGALGIGAKPVFGQQGHLSTKLDQPNHLGDVSLVSGAVPVYIANQSSQSGRPGLAGSLPFGLSGATAALAGILALGGGAAKAAPGIVQSTIDFGSGVTSTGPGQIFGGGNVFGGGSILGGPGGTPGFAGNVTGLGTAGPGGGVTSLGGFSGLKGILSQLGGIGMDKGGLPGVNGQAGTDLGGGIFGGHGIGGAGGGALLAGGGILAADGLRRGGIGGLLETTAGGAAIGFKFGGPIGALIGAAAGAIAGTIRLFIKSGAEKIIEKVKSVYGITIDKKFAQDPLLALIKQNFGGNIEVGIRSPQVRDLLELYAMSTGQNAGGIVPQVTASVFANQGGVLSAQSVFTNGSPTSFSGGSALGNGVSFGVLSPSKSPASAPAQNITVQNLTLQVGPDSLGKLVDGRAASVIQSSGRLVSAAANDGQKASAARRESVATNLLPNYVVG